MKATAPRKRRRWPWLLGVPLLALCAWAGLRALLEPERLSAYLLRQAQAASGLEFALDAPADVGFWPDLHLRLDGLSARAPGAASPLLRVTRVEAVLPWSVLRAPTLQLRRLRLLQPQLELPLLQAWLAGRADAGPPAPLQLPELEAALEIEAGAIVASDWRIDNLAVQLDSLLPGRPARLAASGGWQPSGQAPQAFALRLDATPKQQGDALRLEPLTLQLEAPFAATLAGHVLLRHPRQLQLALQGSLPGWPAGWPALPLPRSEPATAMGLTVEYDGMPDLSGELALRLQQGDAALAGATTLGALRSWLDTLTATGLPPLRAELQAPTLELGTTRLHGVRLRVRDAAPATEDRDAGS
jgi:hypothetical protein